MKRKIGILGMFAVLYGIFVWGFRLVQKFVAISDDFSSATRGFGAGFSSGNWAMMIIAFTVGCIGLILLALEIWFHKKSWKKAEKAYLILWAATVVICVCIGGRLAKNQSKYLEVMEELNAEISLEELNNIIENGEDAVIFASGDTFLDISCNVRWLMYDTGIEVKHYEADSYSDLEKYGITELPVLLHVKDGKVVKCFEGVAVDESKDYFISSIVHFN